MNASTITIKIRQDLPSHQIGNLYNSVGWVVYTSQEQLPKLQQAIQNSSYVVTAWSGEKLIGLARCVSDDVSIAYLQDILVDPAYQRQGVGRKLLRNCLERFEHVRVKVLITDDEERQRLFYESLGFKNTKDLRKTKLNAYVKMAGVELE